MSDLTPSVPEPPETEPPERPGIEPPEPSGTGPPEPSGTKTPEPSGTKTPDSESDIEIITKESTVDDSNQYNEFYINKESLQPERSFPASEHSVEVKAFKDDFGRILACLRRNEIKWQSVECVGRLADEKKIRTTVLIGLSPVPDDTEQQTLRSKVESVMRHPLHIEFAEGGFDEESHFGFKERQQPLACGSSCGIAVRRSTGSIGGFVTIKGDPDKKAVYAVSCHHVMSKGESIEWPANNDYASRLGIDDKVREHLERLGEEELVSEFSRESIRRLAELPLRLQPRFREITGTDRDAQTAYLQQIVGQFFHLLGEAPANGNIEQIVGSVLLRRLRPFHEDLERMESLFAHGEPDRDLVGAFVNYILWDMDEEHMTTMPTMETAKAMRAMRTRRKGVLQRLLSLRQVCRKLNLGAMVEHPSGSDRRGLRRRLRSEEVESLALANQPMDPIHQQWQLADATSLQQALDVVSRHHRSFDRFIGVVWASIFSTHHRIEPRNGRVDNVIYIKEDWALIKLFPEVQTGIRSVFDRNILRPLQPLEHFTHPKPWRTLESSRVSKRGRTTDYTIGKINATISAGKRSRSDDTPTLEYTIIATGANGLFSQPGDSGSWVMDKCGQVVGMVWGKSKASKNTLFTPAEFLFNWIGRTFEAAMRAQNVPIDGTPPQERVQVV